jgi:hypothetical protein
MNRRRRLRRRLLWAGVLLGLVLLLATVSVMRVALWTRSAVGVGVHRIDHVRGPRHSAALS